MGFKPGPDARRRTLRFCPGLESNVRHSADGQPLARQSIPALDD
jgi:hypothetical protein